MGDRSNAVLWHSHSITVDHGNTVNHIAAVDRTAVDHRTAVDNNLTVDHTNTEIWCNAIDNPLFFRRFSAGVASV